MRAQRSIALFLHFVLTIILSTRASGEGELMEAGHTYNQAQTIRWLDEQRFAVGRWDGSITIFRRPAFPRESGPVILQALTAPSFREIGKVDVLPSGELITSSSSDSISVWTPKGKEYRHAHEVDYDAQAGDFNSGSLVEDGGWATYVSGHANGYLIRWHIGRPGQLWPEAMLDVRSPDPIPSPYMIKNVRGVVPWRDGIVITAAEDGDLCLVDVRSMRVIHRQRYNPAAQRGLNGLAVFGDLLLATNCTVGTAEHNAWLYRITASNLTLLDSRYLATDPKIADIFSVSAALVPSGKDVHFYASTGEGIVWHGKVEDERLLPLDSVTTGHRGVAPVFDLEPEGSLLASVDHDIRVFQLRQIGGATRRIALVHMVPRLGDVDSNRRIIEEAIRKAARAGADWIVTPELSESGYKFITQTGTGWIEKFPSSWMRDLSRLAARQQVSLFVGFPEREAGSGELHNSVAVIDRSGALLGTYRKIKVIPGPYESWAIPGVETPVFTVDGTRIGILICADSYAPEIAREYAAARVDLLLSSAAWAPGSMGPNGAWEARSQETGLPLIVCNRSGIEPGLDFRESESVVDQNGKRLFTFSAPGTTVFLVDWDRAHQTFTQAGSIPIEFRD